MRLSSPVVWSLRGLMALAVLVLLGGAAQVGGSVPASRQADRVAVITIEGAIDRVTAMSVRRRIEEAEAGGFGAMVFEIDSPGGGVGAVLEITGAIKSSSIVNTVAWVNSDAYSGGAIIALACREIVSSSPAAMGDAFPVIPTLIGDGSGRRSGLRGLTADERTKLLPPLMADVTDSARRNGYDESLVQAVVINGIELWLVEDKETGERYAINDDEYRALFGEDPVRGMPMIATVTGGRDSGSAPSAGDAVEEAGEVDSEGADTEEADAGDDDGAGNASVEEEDGADGDAGGDGVAPGLPDPARDRNAFRPADESLEDIAREFASSERIGELTLEEESTRPVFVNEDGADYTLVGYVTDGTAPIVMRDDQLIEMGFSSGVVRDDAALKAFMGAKELVRADESWSESLVRVMTSLPVRGVLIVVLILGVFVELVTAGTGIGTVVALAALAGIIGPPAMIGLAGWWEIVAIGVGIIALLIEAFVVPGFGFFGVLGVIALFTGVMGTFIPSGSSLSNPAVQQDLLSGAVTLILSLATAGVAVWLIMRQLDHIPLLDRIVLSGASGVTAEPRSSGMLSAMARDDALKSGDEGVATTDLRPSGEAEIGGKLVDVVASLGYVDRGTRVRVVRVEGYRVVVDEVGGGPGSGDEEKA